MRLESLLAPGAVQHDFYWSDQSYRPPREPWTELAAVDPMFTAASVDSESEEARKSKPTVEMLASHLQDGVVLDLGCGYGRLAKYLLREHTYAGYIGVDGAPTMLGHFWRRYSESEDERRTPLLLVRASIDEIPIESGAVDNVVISGVLFHNAKAVARRAVGEVARILRSGGTLIVVSDLPNARTLAGAQGWAVDRYLQLSGQPERNGPVRFYSKRALQELFREFSSVKVRPDGLSLLPKGIQGIGSANRFWRRRIYEPVQRVGERTLPRRWQQRLCAHFEVVATR